jgi:hypothetical protein
MDDALLDSLLGNIDTPAIPKFKCVRDYQTWYPKPVRTVYGGYKRPVSCEVTVCDSLNISNGQKEYEIMIDDMIRMSLARTRGLMVEKRSSRYERAQKSK